MKRYLTIENYDGSIAAYPESDTPPDWLKNLDVAEWVWQFAESVKHAISQHHEKHDQWAADMDAGRPEKNTY